MNDIAAILKDSKGHVLDGVCSRCCHCGLNLTDAVSVERGIGPICSAKGYHADQKDGDPAKAMAILAEFPELLDFLVTKYYSNEADPRKFMNGLVRVASLNRGDLRLHEKISDAVEALGWGKLADATRESLAVIEIHKPAEAGTPYRLRVKNRSFKWAFTSDLRQVPGVSFSRYPRKSWAFPESSKPAVWEIILKHYEGECGRIVGGLGFKIERKRCEKAAA